MTIDTEIIWLVLFGLLSAIAAMAGALVMTARASSASSEATRRAANANTQITAALVAVNNELQEAACERRENAAERLALKNEVDLLKTTIRQMREEHDLYADRQSSTVAVLQSRVKQAEKINSAQISELEKLKRDHAREIQGLTDRIKKLEDERDALRKERTMLITKLTAVEKERDGLVTRVSELEAKVDKLQKTSTGPLSASEPGESNESSEPERKEAESSGG